MGFSGGGVLLAGSQNGGIRILVGIRQRDRSVDSYRGFLESRLLRAIVDDCWTNPFGTMDPQDGGDHRRCAARELVEEILLGRETSNTCEDLAPRFDEWAGLGRGDGLLEQVGRSRESVSRVPFFSQMKIYFVRVARLGPTVRSHEFPDGLAWRDPAEVLAEPRVHWGLSMAIRFFSNELKDLPKA